MCTREGLIESNVKVHVSRTRADLHTAEIERDMCACLEAAERLAARLAFVLSSSRSRASRSSSVTRFPGTALQCQTSSGHYLPHVQGGVTPTCALRCSAWTCTEQDDIQVADQPRRPDLRYTHLTVISLSYSSAISSAVTSCLTARLAHRSSIATSANLYLLLTNADLKSADMLKEVTQVANRGFRLSWQHTASEPQSLCFTLRCISGNSRDIRQTTCGTSPA